MEQKKLPVTDSDVWNEESEFTDSEKLGPKNLNLQKSATRNLSLQTVKKHWNEESEFTDTGQSATRNLNLHTDQLEGGRFIVMPSFHLHTVV